MKVIKTTEIEVSNTEVLAAFGIKSFDTVELQYVDMNQGKVAQACKSEKFVGLRFVIKESEDKRRRALETQP